LKAITSLINILEIFKSKGAPANAYQLPLTRALFITAPPIYYNYFQGSVISGEHNYTPILRDCQCLEQA